MVVPASVDASSHPCHARRQPSRNAPSPHPSAAIASVTTATRSGPTASAHHRGCTYAVGDDFDGHPRVAQQRQHGSGRPMVQRRHRVEQVGADCRAQVDGVGLCRSHPHVPRRQPLASRKRRIAIASATRVPTVPFGGEHHLVSAGSARICVVALRTALAQPRPSMDARDAVPSCLGQSAHGESAPRRGPR